MTHTIPECFYRISIKALIKNGDKILLCKGDSGLYDFPGGGLESGEAPKDGLKREIHEEMGLTVTKISEKPVCFLTTESLTKKPIANIFYEVEVADLNFTPSDECREIGFFSLDEIQHLEVFPNVTEFIKTYQP